MTKEKSSRRHNKLLIAPRNYYDLGSVLNRAAGNPENGKLTTGLFKGMSTGLSGTLQGLGNSVGQIGGSIISNGMTSGAGNVLSGLSNIAGMIPGPWGAVASAGLGLASGVTNSLFGAKFNNENIARVEANINNLKNFQSNASDFDSLLNNWSNAETGMTFSDRFIGKDGMFSNKVGDKASSLRDQIRKGNKWVQDTLINNANNIKNTQIQNLLGNYSAFGGPIDFGGGAIDYDFMNKYLGIKELAALGQDASLTSLPNSFAEGGGIHIKKTNRGKFTDYCGGNVTAECIERGKKSSSPAIRKRATFAANARKWKHAFGGDLLTHGSNFDTGITLIGNGGTHEENPNEGVPIGMDAEGTPNLVEEGEVIFNDYVFSNRLIVPKEVRKKYKLRGTKPLTFADAAIQMSKESKERPNDPISQAGFMDSMTKLMIEQEQIRIKKEPRGKRFDWGGFPDYATRLRFQYPYLNQSTRDQLVLSDINSRISQPLGLSAPELDFSSNIKPNTIKTDTSFGTIETPTIGSHVVYPWDEPVPDLRIPTMTKERQERKKESSMAPTWMRYIPAFASGVMSITDALGLTNKPDYSEAEAVLEAARGAGTYDHIRFNPIGNYLTYKPFDRDYYTNKLNAESSAARRAILNTSGSNRAQAMAGILAADYTAQGKMGDLFRQAEEYNLAQKQKVEEFNRATNMFNSEGIFKADQANQAAQLQARSSYLRGALTAAELRQREKQASVAARSANLSNFINSLGDIGRENFSRNMIVSDPSKYYTIGANGEISYKDFFYDLPEAEQDYIIGHANRRSKSKRSKGGCLTIKRK